ncbi:MAG: hypothetical protein P0120_11565 [Nitrospira sp.]|nr:hypothetical protein [Nitrospira sp.]
MSIKRATVLWIEAEPLSGGSHSQVEFPVEVGPFFGGSSNPAVGNEMDISVRCAGISFAHKKMDFHHNNVWRLNLPTAKQGLGQYRDSLLVFQKTDDRGRFLLWKEIVKSPLGKKLRKQAKKKGQIIRRRKTTGGFRECGCF